MPATTLNKVCLSGLVAITDAARLIRLGEAQVVVAGGQESMTNAPHVLRVAQGPAYGSVEMVDVTAHDGLTDAFDHESMGSSTERFNERYGLGRAEQDEIAAASHVRAGQAQADGVFDAEIVPVEIPQRKGDPIVVAADEGVRPDSTPEVLGEAPPAFAEGGSITAGNSSPLSDGAAAVVVASRAWAEERGLPWLALVGASGQVAGPDNSLHSQPANAIAAALERRAGPRPRPRRDQRGLRGRVAAVDERPRLDREKVNVHGGAIALGHPIGASGARLALHAALELLATRRRQGGGRACGGGGQGEALLLARRR